MELTKREKKKLRQTVGSQSVEAGQSGLQHVEQAKSHQINVSHNVAGKSVKKHIVIAAILLLIASGIAFSVYSYNKPGQYDNFAKCLNEKGAVIYGAISWCTYTQAQKTMFGKSFKHLNYKDYSELPGIKKTPTWVIDGKWYENVQSFDRLSQLTGCNIA